MKRWVFYSVVFLLGGLSALIVNPSFFSRDTSMLFPKKSAISEGAASVSAIPMIESFGLAQDREESMKVVRVIDGDTIELTDGRRVRYIGVDTPEIGDPRRNIECFAKEAMEENKRLVEGKTVRLEKDVSETDRYGRLLRYVYIGDVFVNAHLVRQGFARIDTVPPDVAHQQKFLQAEQEAREQGRGLWREKSCLL